MTEQPEVKREGIPEHVASAFQICSLSLPGFILQPLQADLLFSLCLKIICNLFVLNPT